jgi:hypothetical protein
MPEAWIERTLPSRLSVAVPPFDRETVCARELVAKLADAGGTVVRVGDARVGWRLVRAVVLAEPLLLAAVESLE